MSKFEKIKSIPSSLKKITKENLNDIITNVSNTANQKIANPIKKWNETNQSLLTHTEILQQIEDAEFTDLYGGSIVFTGLFIIVFILVCIFLFSYTYLKSFREEWNTVKCFSYFPLFAGIIDPKEGKSMADSIGDTYKECAENIVVTNEGIKDNARNVQSVKNSINEIKHKNTKRYHEIDKKINMDMEKSVNYFNDFQGLMKYFAMYGQKIYSGMYDIYGRFIGSVISVIYGVETSYYVLKGYIKVLEEALWFQIGSMITFVLYLPGYMTTLIVKIFIAIFSFDESARKSVLFQLLLTILFMLFGLIVIPVLTIISGIILGIIDKTNTIIIDNIPACFAHDTPIKLLDETTVPIQNIQINDVLSDGSVVISTIKVPYNKYKDKLVSIDDIIVTTEHKIKYKNHFVEVGSLRDSIKNVDKYTKEWLYCINTNTKQIQIKDKVFLDWDDMDYHERRVFERNLHIVKHPNSFYYNHLYVNMISGLDGNTKVRMFNDNIKRLKDLEVGDLTENKEVILGVMKISGKYTPLVTTNIIKNVKHTCNIAFADKIYQDFYDKKMKINTSGFVNTLYHVVTNKGTITITNDNSVNDNNQIDSLKSYTLLDYDKTNERILNYKTSWIELYNHIHI